MAKTIKFFYDKSHQHSEILVDGAVGGLSPNARLVMSVYTERVAIPKSTVHQLQDDDTLGDELTEQRDGKEGIQRTLHATLHMDIEQARRIYEWIGKHLQSYDEKEK